MLSRRQKLEQATAVLSAFLSVLEEEAEGTYLTAFEVMHKMELSGQVVPDLDYDVIAEFLFDVGALSRRFGEHTYKYSVK